MEMTAENDAAWAETVWLKNYAPPNHLIPEVALSFELGDEETRVSATLKVVANPKGEAGAPLELHGGDQQLLSLRLDGVELGP